MLRAFADTTQVNGVSTAGPYGYPHNAFVLQTAGTLTPGGSTKWGGSRGGSGWWITGTRNVCSAGQSTDCSTG